MQDHKNAAPVPGWIGGFEASNPAFAYPTPDLSSLPLLDNMDNIDRLQRQQKVLWPEFSWETLPGQPDSRCYQMFAPDISRLGYTDTGRVYSIICPQQGACSPSLGCMNVEVTVTGQRGWSDEPSRTLAADMSVEGVIWFGPSARENPLMRLLWHHFENESQPFPFDKAHAIKVTTHLLGDPAQPIFPLRTGQSDGFPIPAFAQHPEAWAVGHLGVQIGDIKKTGDAKVDAFNALVMELFNAASGNMLKAGNLLTWNVWFAAPELVDQAEWRAHALKWRTSIDADHGSPDGPGTSPRYFDGRTFEPGEELVVEEREKILDYLKNHL